MTFLFFNGEVLRLLSVWSWWKFGQIVKGSIFKLGKTKFDSCVLIWFLIFCYVKVFVTVDQFLIFWQCLTTLRLSVVKNIDGVCIFLLLFFYGVLLLMLCVCDYVCLCQKKWYLRLFKLWAWFFYAWNTYMVVRIIKLTSVGY